MFYISAMRTAPSNCTANQPTRCPRCSRKTEEERLTRQLSGLKELTEIGLAFARALNRELQAAVVESQSRAMPAPPPPDETPAPAEPRSNAGAEATPKAPPARPSYSELGRTFDRVSRALRFGYLLEEKLVAGFLPRAPRPPPRKRPKRLRKSNSSAAMPHVGPSIASSRRRSWPKPAIGASATISWASFAYASIRTTSIGI